ncbi:MAG TPA: glycosyltransferase [Methylophilaceae bacterium]|nr:glycosyltransferase [Methylophilaceae bacterium]
MLQTEPQVSVVLEWENALLSELGRTRVMLQRLKEQVKAQPLSFEIIVLYNPEQIDRALISSELEAVFANEARINYRIEAASGLHYYELKNYGVSIAAADLVVFVDSDVIPEEDWLANILTPLLEDDKVMIVAGTSYIDPVDFIGKSFALSWLFPLRSPHHYVDPKAKSLHANNLAFRKAFFLQRPFPAMKEGVTRGACSDFATRIIADGYQIHRQHAARVSHPPPNGFVHTFIRALAEGRDAAFRLRPSLGRFARALKVARKFVRKIFNRAIIRIIRDHKRVNMPLWQVPAAVVLMTAYYLLALVGGIVAALKPSLVTSRFQI